MKSIELFMTLQRLDKNTLSCLRGDLEKMHRSEVSLMSSSEAADPEVHSRYVKGLETFLDFLCALEGYDRNVPSFNLDDLVQDNPELPQLVEALAEQATEEPSKKWVTA